MSEDLQQFLDSVVAAGGYASQRRLYYYTQYMLGDVSGVEKALDIGGGAGILSFYLVSQGARKVVCLEPEGDGSTDEITELFRTLQTVVQFGGRVELIESPLQEYDPEDEKFDLIVSANAINHLNEEACIDLKTNRESYDTFMGYFKTLFDMLNNGGRLTIADCSRYNFFPAIHMTNPLMPTIEWEKHQSPYMWISMLKEVGFIRPKIQWRSYNTLGPLGRLLMGNALVNYFTLGHFKFTMWKP